MNGNNVTYFDSFGVEHIPKQILKFIGNKNVITNNFRIQAYNSGFDFMLKGKSLFYYTILFSPNEHEKNDNVILKYFQSLKMLR